MKELCGCCEKKPAQDMHTCPFAEEIHGDEESLCNCCEDCETKCCDDI